MNEQPWRGPKWLCLIFCGFTVVASLVSITLRVRARQWDVAMVNGLVPLAATGFVWALLRYEQQVMRRIAQCDQQIAVLQTQEEMGDVMLAQMHEAAVHMSVPDDGVKH